MTLKFYDNGRGKIHSTKCGKASVSDGYEEIVTTGRYVVMPWKMVNADGKRVSLKEAVDEILGSQDELTNSRYVTLKLDDKGSCKIDSAKCGKASVSDGDRRDPPAHKEIVTNKMYVVMPWKMVTRNGKNMTLKEEGEEIETHRRKIEEERMLVSEFEAEHKTDSIVSSRSLKLMRGKDRGADKYVKKVKALIDKPLEKMGSHSDPGPIELKHIRLHVRLAMATVKCNFGVLSIDWEVTSRPIKLL